MRKFELIAPCHFGLESILKREIEDIGYEVVKVQDGRVTFEGDEEAVARANICLRTAERILIKVGEFTATTYDELFEATKALDWENYIPKDARFNVVKASSIKSKLFSPSDIQSIMKKAMVERLKLKYNVAWFDETGVDYPVRVTLLKDVVTVGLDTTGVSLHKRGYRKLVAKAPIAENLAAALIMLTPWHGDRILVDPFSGSGTFPIEAALMAANIAPGMNRRFIAQEYKNLVPASFWKDAFTEARDEVNLNIETDIQGYDIDPKMVETAKANASLAGIDKLVHFEKRDVKDLRSSEKYGFIITNPPYGERLEEKENLLPLYGILGQRFSELQDWSMFMITSYDKAEEALKRKADKNRKIYNGMMKTYFYSFMGKKPEKKRD
jgi:putative N6-adenine-specific DNA methylase